MASLKFTFDALSTMSPMNTSSASSESAHFSSFAGAASALADGEVQVVGEVAREKNAAGVLDLFDGTEPDSLGNEVRCLGRMRCISLLIAFRSCVA